RIPDIPAFMDLVASWQVRTRSTVGGNLINASPIGDVTILMLALGAVAVFEDVAGGGVRRMPLDRLYLGYKQLDRRPSEVLIEVLIPDVAETDRVRFEKVSKRRWLDIASVNAAARLRLRGGVLESARLAVGGVAPVPLFLEEASAALSGAAPTVPHVAAALDVADGEMSPISDVRGAAAYKRRLARHLLAAAVVELLPDELDAGEVYAKVAAS
ncbi:MAG: FAD binding domain-containing protein, partial [Acidobacteriota bacterium]